MHFSRSHWNLWLKHHLVALGRAFELPADTYVSDSHQQHIKSKELETLVGYLTGHWKSTNCRFWLILIIMNHEPCHIAMLNHHMVWILVLHLNISSNKSLSADVPQVKCLIRVTFLWFLRWATSWLPSCIRWCLPTGASTRFGSSLAPTVSASSAPCLCQRPRCDVWASHIGPKVWVHEVCEDSCHRPFIFKYIQHIFNIYSTYIQHIFNIFQQPPQPSPFFATLFHGHKNKP